MQMFCYSHSLHNPYFDLCSSSFHCCLAKVDMFSYGMVLYELLSGRRPALGQHQLQIAKKLSKGVRPALGNPEEVQFHCLHRMLTECWDTKPERVRSCPHMTPTQDTPRSVGWMCRLQLTLRPRLVSVSTNMISFNQLYPSDTTAYDHKRLQ